MHGSDCGARNETVLGQGAALLTCPLMACPQPNGTSYRDDSHLTLALSSSSVESDRDYAVGVHVWDWFGDGSTAVVDLALACCAVESEFAVPEGARRLDAVPDGARPVAIVSGTLTNAVAGLVRDTIRGLGDDVHVVSFGACACAGGPYWDSYAVTRGVDQLVAVDHYIAGCPPPPSALADHLAALRSGERA